MTGSQDDNLLQQTQGRGCVACAEKPASSLVQLIRVACRFCRCIIGKYTISRMPAPKLVNMFAVPFAFGLYPPMPAQCGVEASAVCH